MTDSLPPRDSSSPAEEGQWSSAVDTAALTDIGRRRSNNQDSHRIVLADSSAQWNTRGHLFLVADGMGAHAAGELASMLAVELIPHYYKKFHELPAHEALVRAFESANGDIYSKGQSSFQLYSMGTTGSGLVLLPEGAVAVHVGDSRIYQLDGEVLYQLTFDHSLVWEMQALGRATDEMIRSGLIPKNVITRSIGPGATVKADLEGPFPVRSGNRFLLCSDGLSGEISDQEIATILLLLPPPKATQFFVDLANLRGGRDNITAIVVEVKSGPVATARAGEPVAPKQLPPWQPMPQLPAIAAGICLLAACLLALLGYATPSVVAAAAGVIALMVVAFKIFPNFIPQSKPTVPIQARYGDGPYRQFPAKATEAFFANLSGAINRLQELCSENGLTIDWAERNSQLTAIGRFASKHDYASAIRAQVELITDVMAEMRRAEHVMKADEVAKDSESDPEAIR